jgi:gentisate 1,2-dioxygenase
MDTFAIPEPSSEAYQSFCREVEQVHGWPLWLNEVLGKRPSTVPYLWKYRDYRPLLMKAADIVPMELSPRRVLVMSNPGIAPARQASNTLLATCSSSCRARSRPRIATRSRRCASMMDGEGAYTAVDGERVTMFPGDFIVTPDVDLARPWQSRATSR